jgi:hypothetical protein
MKPLNEIFDVEYGDQLDFNKMKPKPKQEGGLNFVGRSSRNLGVVGSVALIPSVKPNPAGTITVALGGSILASFVQIEPYYTAQNVAVLLPKNSLSFAEKLYLCLCIERNRFRYSTYGREANVTLKSLMVPDPNGDFPEWVNSVDVDIVTKSSGSKNNLNPPLLKPVDWSDFKLVDLFEIKKGKRLTKRQMAKGVTPFIGAIDKDNGVAAYINKKPDHPANTITVSYNGSIGETFYQPIPFCATDDVNILYPKFSLTPAIGIFLTAVIRREKYKFNYGRKWNLDRMRITTIKLPVISDGSPDWAFMEKYINSLPYSSEI